MRLKRPKLPKGVCFVDEGGFKVKEKKMWEDLSSTVGEIVLRIAVRGIPREFRLRRQEVVRILFGEKLELENYSRFEPEFEEEVDEFVFAAIWWARDKQLGRERRAIAWRRLRIFPEANRIMKPTRFKNGAGQSRLF